MGKIVVVAEKPSVGRDIARVLGCRTGGDGCLIGDRYIVTWAVGHLVTLVEPNELDPKQAVFLYVFSSSRVTGKSHSWEHVRGGFWVKESYFLFWRS